MSTYRCTIEYRLNNGSIQHQTHVLEANDGARAAEMARQGWMGGHEPGPEGESGVIEEIVCAVDEDHAH